MSDLGAPQVLLPGEALIDIVSPLDGEPSEHVGGSVANVAIGLARLGHTTELATHIGTDPRGRRIADLMAAESVRLSPGSETAQRTPTALATLDATGAATYEFDLSWKLDGQLPVTAGTHLHCGSYSATVEPGATAVRQILERNRRYCTISYDPNARPSIMLTADHVLVRIEDLIALADVVKASDEDVAWLYGGADPAYAVRRWIARGAALAVVTRGALGVMLAKGEQILELPAPAVSVVDTVGAGDSFMAGLLSGLLDAGLLGGAAEKAALKAAPITDIVPAVQRGLACAAITVSRAGANPPRRDEIL